MDHKLTKGSQSNYEITLIVSKTDFQNYKSKALENFQKEMEEPGFRTGHVPLDIVERKVRPEYLEVAMYEEAIHEGMREVLAHYTDKKFIGNIYDLNKEEKEEIIHFTFKLDEYPEVEVKGDERKNLSVKPINPDATPEEIEETLLNLKKQYANYLPAETISGETVFKVQCSYKDSDAAEVDKKTLFLGKEEWDAHDILKTHFEGKKTGEVVEIRYDETVLPSQLHSQKKESNPALISCTIQDIRKVELPEFTPETIKKFFGNDEVTDEAGLKEKIATLIKQQKEEMQLMQSIDEMLTEARNYLSILIPKTLVEEEVKTRMKSLEEKMGGEKGLQEYYTRIGDEQKAKMTEDITVAAKTSLEKFFVLQKLTELLGIKDIDRQKPLDVEKKLYAQLTTQK